MPMIIVDSILLTLTWSEVADGEKERSSNDLVIFALLREELGLVCSPSPKGISLLISI